MAACALAACSSCKGSGSDATPSATRADASVAATAGARADEVIDLTEVFREGVIDSAGPVVDLGERQAARYVVSAAALPSETVNGDSWVSVGTRLRLRVPIGEGDPPTSVRLRVRRASSRGVALMVDGVLVRAVNLPQDGAPRIITLPVPAGRFARSTADVELRFGTPRAVPGVLSPVAAQIDWVHIARREVPPSRVADLVNDVAAERTPRRALTFYAPTRLSTLMLLPTRSTWTASIAAEGARGARPGAPVVAVMRAETDGEEPIEERVEIAPNGVWHDAAIDLTPFGGRPVRLTLSAEGSEDARLAVAAPSLRHATAPGTSPSSAAAGNGASLRASVRHVVMVVVRGLRVDRVLPTLSDHLTGGGFSRMSAEGTVAVAQAPAPREFSAMVSATTGLPADLHHVSELTDALDDEAPTMVSALAAAGVDAVAYTDDIAWLGSGADRAVRVRNSCAAEAATCHPDWMFSAAAEDLITRRASNTFTLIVTRAGVLPLDPTPEDVVALDPRPYEGTMTPSRTAVYGLRQRSEGIDLAPADMDRLGTLYDASLLAVDRGLGQLLERIRDHNLDDETAVIVVGDRGVALGEGRSVGDGPMTQSSISETLLLARGPGFPAVRVGGVVGVIDAAATVLERFGVAAPAELEGVSLAGGGVAHDRVLGFVATTRWDVGLRFGDLVALPRAARDGGGIALYGRESDALGVTDLAPSRPIARELGEAAMAAFRPGAGRRLFPPSTRVLPAALDALSRFRH